MLNPSHATTPVAARRRVPRLPGFIAAAAVATLAASASAQSIPGWKFTCQAIGVNTAEPVGDRDGHRISVGPYTCHTEGGSMDGANATGVLTWEWDKDSATLLVGDATFRKPGGVAVFQFNEAKISLVMADGKVTGSTSIAKGVFKHASGGMAPYAGKTVLLKWDSVPGGQVVGDTTIE